jgi:hypothetical protein
LSSLSLAGGLCSKKNTGKRGFFSADPPLRLGAGAEFRPEPRSCRSNLLTKFRPLFEDMSTYPSFAEAKSGSSHRVGGRVVQGQRKGGGLRCHKSSLKMMCNRVCTTSSKKTIGKISPQGPDWVNDETVTGCGLNPRPPAAKSAPALASSSQRCLRRCLCAGKV